MNRTGSRSSQVGPAVTSNVLAGQNPAAPPQLRRTAFKISSCAASRPGPVIPQARYPRPGSTTRTPRFRSIARFSWVAGCCHIFTFIAGASTTGAVEARLKCGKKIVSQAARKLRQRISRRRRHQQQIRSLRHRNMLNRGFQIRVAGFPARKKICDHFLAAERGKGKRCDELRVQTASSLPEQYAPRL